MSIQARIYIGFVLTAGAAAIGNGLSSWQLHEPARFLCYPLIAAVASCLKVRLPGITGTMSVLFVVLLAGIVDLGLAETMFMGVASVLCQCFWHAKVRPRAIQLLFTVANISSAIWASH